MQNTTTVEKPDSENKKLFETIDNLSENDLDALPIGAIQLDTNGKILQFNSYESKLANVPKEVANRQEFLQGNCSVHRRAGILRPVQGRLRCKAALREISLPLPIQTKSARRRSHALLQRRTVWVFVRPLGHS